MKELTNKDLDSILMRGNSGMLPLMRSVIAADRALNAPVDRDVMRQAVTALECARDGLLWYQDLHPEDHSGADDEMHTLIDGAIAMIAAAPTPPAEQGVAEVMREALEAIVESHQGFCEHHIHVQAHSSELADIASRALAAAPSPPAEQQGEQEPVAWAVPCSRACADGSMEDGPVQFVDHASSGEYSKRIGIPLYSRPSSDVLATLRAKVQELQGHQWSLNSPGLVVRSEVLALIDKMGGKV